MVKFKRTDQRAFVIIFFLSFLISCKPAERSDDVLIGIWYGAVNSDVHIYYEVSRKWDDSLMGYTGIVEFKLSGLPVEVISLKDDTVRFEELESNQRFTGILNRDSSLIRGKYTNLNINVSWPVNLMLIDSINHPSRPQTPHKPYPYLEEEVTYRNKPEGIDIAGTLTLPDKKGPFPAVLLITGTGQQNRDDEKEFHRPFMVIADHLTRNGIAVLRVDDRGVGGTSRKGPFFNSTTKDLEGDVLCGIEYLIGRKEIDQTRIGLIGHSEGGMIACMAAEESPRLSFIILMAAPAGGYFYEGMIRQDSIGARTKGANEAETLAIMDWCKRFYEIVLTKKNTSIAREKLELLYSKRTKEEKEAFEKTGLGGGSLDIDYALTPHFKYFLSLNPDDYLKHVRCPVLALMGDKDISGPSAQTLKAIEMALKSGGNDNYKITELKNLNHGFQTVSDNADIEETISPSILDILTSWIIECPPYADPETEKD